MPGWYNAYTKPIQAAARTQNFLYVPSAICDFPVCHYVMECMLQLDGCIVWNAHNTVFGSQRSAICAQAVYFLHSTMPSVTCLRLSDVNVMSEWVTKSIYTQRIKTSAAALPNRNFFKSRLNCPNSTSGCRILAGYCSILSDPPSKNSVSEPSVSSRDSEGVGVSRAKTAASGVSDTCYLFTVSNLGLRCMSVSQAAQRRTWFTQYWTSDVAENFGRFLVRSVHSRGMTLNWF